jgi:hypothetical protein
MVRRADSVPYQHINPAVDGKRPPLTSPAGQSFQSDPIDDLSHGNCVEQSQIVSDCPDE